MTRGGAKAHGAAVGRDVTAPSPYRPWLRLQHFEVDLDEAGELDCDNVIPETFTANKGRQEHAKYHVVAILCVMAEQLEKGYIEAISIMFALQIHDNLSTLEPQILTVCVVVYKE